MRTAHGGCLLQNMPTHHEIFTLPNALSFARLVGSPLLIVFAAAGWITILVVWAVSMVITEWLDGYLARVLHQQTKLGARLDTVADAVFYCSVLVALAIYDWQLIADQVVWIAAAIISYWTSWIASLLKFGRLPSYHSWAAKGAWVVIGIGVVALIGGWTTWLFRLSMVIVVLANVEAVLITLQLKQLRVDVPTLWHARQLE